MEPPWKSLRVIVAFFFAINYLISTCSKARQRERERERERERICICVGKICSSQAFSLTSWFADTVLWVSFVNDTVLVLCREYYHVCLFLFWDFFSVFLFFLWIIKRERKFVQTKKQVRNLKKKQYGILNLLKVKIIGQYTVFWTGYSHMSL